MRGLPSVSIAFVLFSAFTCFGCHGSPGDVSESAGSQTEGSEAQYSVEIRRAWEAGSEDLLGEEDSFASIKDIAVGPGQRVYVLDAVDQYVKVFTFDGKLQAPIRLHRGKGPGELSRPVSIAADTCGTLFIADADRMCVVELDGQGNFEREVSVDVQPVRVAVSRDGAELFVVGLFEYMGPRVFVYDARTGKATARFVPETRSAKGVHSAGYPDCLAVADRYIFYAPPYPYIVRMYTRSRVLARQIVGDDRGSPGPRRDKLGMVFSPFVVADMAASGSGRLAVLVRWVRHQQVDWSIDVFTPEGHWVGSVPSKVIDRDALATCVAVGDGRRLYVGFSSPYPKLYAVDVVPVARDAR